MTNPTSTLLPLADIHLQSAPGMWPLAWGWWLLIFFTLIIFVLMITFLVLQAKKKQARKDALLQVNASSSLAQINSLLKRAALSYFDREQVAGLTGHCWLAFLDNQLPIAKQGFITNETLWLKGVFSEFPLSEEELTTCKALAKRWLKHALPPRQSTPLSSSNHVQETDHV